MVYRGISCVVCLTEIKIVQTKRTRSWFDMFLTQRLIVVDWRLVMRSSDVIFIHQIQNFVASISKLLRFWFIEK